MISDFVIKKILKSIETIILYCLEKNIVWLYFYCFQYNAFQYYDL